MQLSLRLSDVDPKAAKEKAKTKKGAKRKRVNGEQDKSRAASYNSSIRVQASVFLAMPHVCLVPCVNTDKRIA